MINVRSSTDSSGLRLVEMVSLTTSFAAFTMVRLDLVYLTSRLYARTKGGRFVALPERRMAEGLNQAVLQEAVVRLEYTAKPVMVLSSETRVKEEEEMRLRQNQDDQA